MRRAAIAIAVLAGCSFHPHASGTDGPGGDDDARATADVSPQPVDAMLGACISIADLGVNLCPMNPAGPALEVSGDTSLKTDDGTTMPPNAAIACAPMKAGSTPAVCALYATSIKIDLDVTLSSFGGKPLVLLATQSIDIEGTLDVASHIGGQVGAGSPHAGCSAGTKPGTAGGGQGGSYGTAGGAGGDADGASGTGGVAGSMLAIDALAGGCPGANGDMGGMGGAGGGATFLATPMLVVGDGGAIDASGASGAGAPSGKHGGGGGGAGGLVAITVGTLYLVGDAQVFANGGHGGGGSSQPTAGGDGSDPTNAASGGGSGSAGDNGGNGGSGADRDAAATGMAATGGNDGGGGGGGGAGALYIRPASPTNTANVSPSPI
ncbi:MAG TPA: hypothetical protein VGL61_30880 [Kofleriaceae bacterium]|jgi:hypothetical protein